MTTMYTRKNIETLLAKNDAAVTKALQTVKSTCGFCHGGWNFGKSLLTQVSEGKELTKSQLTAARDLLKDYVPLLVRVANQKTEAKKQEEEARYQEMAEECRAEREAEEGMERYYENLNERYFDAHYGDEPFRNHQT